MYIPVAGRWWRWAQRGHGKSRFGGGAKFGSKGARFSSAHGGVRLDGVVKGLVPEVLMFQVKVQTGSVVGFVRYGA